jgi:hypothetical protein
LPVIAPNSLYLNNLTTPLSSLRYHSLFHPVTLLIYSACLYLGVPGLAELGHHDHVDAKEQLELGVLPRTRVPREYRYISRGKFVFESLCFP